MQGCTIAPLHQRGLPRDFRKRVAEILHRLIPLKRELGIGDNGVPKRMKKLAGMFYGRLDSYARALESNDSDALEVALRRNIHPENAEEALSMRLLADYMMTAENALKAVPESVLANGDACLPVAAKEEA